MNQSVVYAVDDLSSRLRTSFGEGRCLAYCFGSGLTAPKVPGVTDALRLMQYEMRASEDDQVAFAQAVEGLDGGRAYQAAARLILGRRRQATLNRVVREMVLSAHGPTLSRLADDPDFGPDDLTDEYCEMAEGELDAWYLPEPVTRLAELLANQAQRAGVPVLTTNFDPLIEIAVRRAGGTALTMKFDQDGTLGDLILGHEVLVAHLHGFWREGDTLHAAAQLTQDRPQLERSLERLLGDRTMVVSGYGGWDDVVTASLAEAARFHGSGELDVIWVFRNGDLQQVSAYYGELLRQYASVAGHVTFYAGADCGAVVGLIEDAEAWGQADAPGTDFSSPLTGWSAVTPAFLDRQRAAPTAEELVRFFDGQVPTWRHAQAEGVPKLEATRRAIAAIGEASDLEQSSVLLLLGPSGEGKSLAVLQTGADYARTDGWRVMWRETGVDAPCDVDALETGPWRWLLILDDADADIGHCIKAVRRLHESGRDDVVLLLAARTADWRAARGQAKPWSEYANFVQLDARGLLAEDAPLIVEAWEAAGPAGLGEFVALDDKNSRTQVLLNAARVEASTPEGSLFGAMLKVRVGAGLRDHVRTLGERLRERRLSSSRSLLQAFLYVASLHSHGILSLQPVTLASALAISPRDVHREVVWPLGEEAALSTTGTRLRVRHRAIAEAAIALAADLGEDPAQIYYEVIGAAALVRKEGTYVTDLHAIVYLPAELVADPRIAIRAAQAPVDIEPDRISYRINLAAILRRCGEPEAGLKEAREAFSRRGVAPDAEAVRATIFEWAVCAGNLGRPAVNSYLCLVALADDLEPAAGESATIKPEYSPTGGLERLVPVLGGTPWLNAAWAAAGEVDRMADGGHSVADIDAVIAAFGTAATELVPLLEEKLPAEVLPGPEGLRFDRFARVLGEAG